MNVDIKAQQQARTVKVLKDAKALISNPQQWTCHAHARSADGRSVQPKSYLAVAHDASGAIQKVDPVIYRNNQTGLADPTLSPAWQALQKVVRPASVSGFNDNNTHADVLDGFDRAVARLVVPR
jgi:hypothetical protein